MTVAPAHPQPDRPARVVLIGRTGCHLCQDARAVVSDLCDELDIPFGELSTDDDPRLAEQWYELLPVVLVDGVEVAHWWVDAAALRTTLTGIPRRGGR